MRRIALFMVPASAIAETVDPVDLEGCDRDTVMRAERLGTDPGDLDEDCIAPEPEPEEPGVDDDEPEVEAEVDPVDRIRELEDEIQQLEDDVEGLQRSTAMSDGSRSGASSEGEPQIDMRRLNTGYFLSYGVVVAGSVLSGVANDQPLAGLSYGLTAGAIPASVTGLGFGIESGAIQSSGMFATVMVTLAPLIAASIARSD